MVVFPLFFLAFAGCMWLIFSPGEKEREEPSAGFNTELPTPESEGILSDKRDAYVQEEMRRREREKMRSLQDFAFGMEDEEEEPCRRFVGSFPDFPCRLCRHQPPVRQFLRGDRR